jgi:sugar phosphate isomerase/epimerase
VSIVKIGIQTRGLRQPLNTALRTAARLGASGVEIDIRSELPAKELSQTGMRQLRKLLDDLNLHVSAAAFPTRHGYDEPRDLERRVLATQAAMRFAAQLGSGVVINRVGTVPSDADAARFGPFLEALTALGTYGDRVGARFAAQTTGENPQALAQLLRALPEHTLGVDLHPSGVIAAGHSPQDAVELLGRHVLHVHACDAVRDVRTGRTTNVELGRGTAELPELLGRLAEFDYRGWVTIECSESVDPATELENGVAFLRAL